ncbi:MAG: DIP1984 family protein [Ktedonobacteraceae bacterium]|nr:DIP1984 family protein [Ktedonobacteraceae bacterium]
MKLAEALVLRADIQKRLAQMRVRLQQSALVQEDEQPPENPVELLAELEQLLSQLGAMIARVNRTNLQTLLPDGATLTDALARRDVLDMRYSMISDLANTAANRIERYGRAEIRKISTVDVAALRRQLDEIARQRRELDTAIQATNWNVDLIE